jgi:hypothetical protein
LERLNVGLCVFCHGEIYGGWESRQSAPSVDFCGEKL